jgi:hypothetical protein
MELSGHFYYFILTFAKFDLASVESTYICVESLVQIGPKLGFLKMLALTLNDLEHGQILPLTQRS